MRWQRFLNSLDTPGGHIVLLFILMLIGIVSYRNGFPKGEDVILAAFGALLGRLSAPREEPKP